jgi:YYY domain-containing protein
MEYGFLVRWLVAYVALWLVAMPLSSALFRRFPDRGAGLALPVALSTLGIVAYWIGRVSFGLTTAVAGILVLGLLSTVAVHRGVDPDWQRAREPMAVFAIAFALVLAIRVVDPAAIPGGGEKFLDLGLLSSLLRGDTLPPQDMWFAGEPVNYYYGGHMIAALLAELTMTPPEFAYNLALPGFYAALVTAAYSVGGAVAAEFDRPRIVGSAFAAFFVGFASNLSTPLRYLAWLLPGGHSVAEFFGFALGRQGGVTIVYGLDRFSYWHASGGMVDGINEFPLFAFLNGDLHAHMMSTPFLLLVVGLLYSYWQTPAASRRRRRLLLFGVVPIVGGLVAVINTWTFPTIAGLTWLTLTFAPGHPSDALPEWLRGSVGGPTGDRWIDDEIDRTAVALGVAVVVTAIAAIVVAPFFAQMVLGSGGNRTLALLPERGGIVGLLLVHGAFLAIATVYLLDRTGVPEHPFRVVVLLLTTVLLAFVVDVAVLAVVVPLLVLAWIVGRAHEDAGFEVVLFVAATGLIVLVEFVYVSEQAGPNRMNTVFKTYMQVWVLLATAAGTMVADVARFRGAAHDLATDARRASKWIRGDRRTATSDGGSPDGLSLRALLGSRLFRPKNVGAILAALLVVSLSVYGGLALKQHFESGRAEPTLDATAFVEERHPGEAAAIEWIDDLEGQPTIVTAPGTSIYRWRNAPSSLTGVPTVAGWVHEVGYRGGEAYWQRVEHVDAIYTGPRDRQIRLLQRYDVQYVYVGPLERDRYGRGIAVADLPGVTPVEDLPGNVTIYRIDQGALSSQSDRDRPETPSKEGISENRRQPTRPPGRLSPR